MVVESNHCCFDGQVIFLFTCMKFIWFSYQHIWILGHLDISMSTKELFLNGCLRVLCICCICRENQLNQIFESTIIILRRGSKYILLVFKEESLQKSIRTFKLCLSELFIIRSVRYSKTKFLIIIPQYWIYRHVVLWTQLYRRLFNFQFTLLPKYFHAI